MTNIHLEKLGRCLPLSELEKTLETCKQLAASPCPSSDNASARPIDIYVSAESHMDSELKYLVAYVERMNQDGRGSFTYTQSELDNFFHR